MQVLLSLSIAILAGLLMTRVAKPLKLPAVTAYLVAGVLIGPYCLGRLGIGGPRVILAKPQTYMNLSGNAVRYWMQQEKIPLERLLIVVDDLSLPVGTIRMKPGGSSAGHNGLKHIAQILGTESYNRLKFGIGNDFPKGCQVDFVLGQFSSEDNKIIDEKAIIACEAIKAFVLSGIQFAMCNYNGK